MDDFIKEQDEWGKWRHELEYKIHHLMPEGGWTVDTMGKYLKESGFDMEDTFVRDLTNIMNKYIGNGLDIQYDKMSPFKEFDDTLGIMYAGSLERPEHLNDHKSDLLALFVYAIKSRPEKFWVIAQNLGEVLIEKQFKSENLKAVIDACGIKIPEEISKTYSEPGETPEWSDYAKPNPNAEYEVCSIIKDIKTGAYDAKITEKGKSDAFLFCDKYRPVNSYDDFKQGIFEIFNIEIPLESEIAQSEIRYFSRNKENIILSNPIEELYDELYERMSISVDVKGIIDGYTKALKACGVVSTKLDEAIKNGDIEEIRQEIENTYNEYKNKTEDEKSIEAVKNKKDKGINI